MKKIMVLMLVLGLTGVLIIGCGTGKTESNKKEDVSVENVNTTKEYFEWDLIDKTTIIGYTEEGLKQTELVIPIECTSVYGLTNNSTVKSIKFENPDTEILENTFVDCTQLEEIELPANLKVIEAGAFDGCINLKSISIPDSVTEIGSNAFLNCEALKNVTFGQNLEIIGRKAFSRCTSLASVILPDSVIEIKKSAFEECSALTEINFGKNLTKLEEQAFQRCIGLVSVKIPEGVTSLEQHEFAFCDSLQEIYLPSTMEQIGYDSIVQTHSIKVYVAEGSSMDEFDFNNLMGPEYYEKQTY